MDADQDYVFLAKCGAMGVYAVCPLFDGDVCFFRNKELGIVASVLKVGDDASCDFAVEFVFEEAAVGTAFAGSVGAVAIVDENLHNAAGAVSGSSSIPEVKIRRDFGKQEFLLPLQRRKS